MHGGPLSYKGARVTDLVFGQHFSLGWRVVITARFLWPLVPLAVLACTGVACGQRITAPLARAPEMPATQARCKVAASRENPLVTEWPASEKANLEALLRQGAVVVAYSGCSLKLLPQCRVRGAYQWRRTTTSTDTLEIA